MMRRRTTLLTSCTALVLALGATACGSGDPVSAGGGDKALSGQTVRMSGYMAPPLKPKLDFFVLTKQPMSTCPFCTTAADWPADIVLVIMPKGRELDPTTRGLQITGRLDIGVKKDEDTGFVSLVRLYADGVTAGG